MNDEILDGDLHIHDADSIEIELLSGAKLLLLCVLTLNFYPLWWMYKKWRFFKENEGLDVMPAARALFAILFTYSLFEQIKTFAVENKSTANYSSVLLFIGLIGLSLAAYLPEPFLFLSIFSSICLLQPNQAFNKAIEKSKVFHPKYYPTFSSQQFILVVIGGLFWAMLLLSLFFFEETNY